MARLTGDIEHQGWRIALGFAGAAPGAASFHAAYTGDAFGRPERGILAAMACGAPPESAPGAAAQIVVHEFAEGYFSLPPTLGPRRAAARVLAGLNDWLAAELRHDSARLAPVSLTALLFHGGALGVLRIGGCRLWRLRQGGLTPLAEPAGAPRLIGEHAGLPADFAADTAEAGDRYIFLSHGQPAAAALLRPGGPEALAAALHGHGPLAAAVMVLDILARPPAEPAGQDLAGLPLRPAPREGDVWDGFRLGKTLYQGRYTMVKAAHDELADREVALKIPLPAMLQDAVFTAGFMREAWIGASVRGAAVARYLDLPAERRRSLYLAMPLYRGETLEARLRRRPAVALPDGIGIALQLCEAVEDLAAIEVIHRDIKPDNVMLLAGGEVRLLDLGLAYLPGIDARDAVRPGGTLRYMAPELIKGQPASPASEVYALAVTLYRMFSGGAYPFGQRERRPLARLRPDLPAWLGAALRRALAAEPAARFADAAGFAAALQQGLAGGQDGRAAPRRLSAAAELRLWRLAALGFAAAFLFMLARALA